MREAVLLVGGQGTRLRPLTLTTPKPLLPVAGVPFLTHQLAALRRAGIEHVVLATSYRAKIFTDTFGDDAGLGLELTYVSEHEPLGTGGAIRNASAGLRSGAGDPVVVLNGDVLSGHDIAGQVDFHERVGADVTLHLVEVPDARAYGCVPTDDEGRVTDFLEKMDDPVTRWINAGSYVFDRAVIDEIPAARVVSVERETFPRLLADGRDVRAWRQTAYWIDVGTPEALVRCSADVVTGIAPTAAQRQPPAEVWYAEATRPEAGAVVDGGSSVGPGVRIGEGAVVHASILMAGAVVAAGARIDHSVLGHEATVGERSHLRGAVVADHADVPAGVALPDGARVEARSR